MTLDKVGAALSALGLGLIVYGLLRSGTWGFIASGRSPPQDASGVEAAGSSTFPHTLKVRAQRQAFARPGNVCAVRLPAMGCRM